MTWRVLVAGAVILAARCAGHETRPAYLHLRETGEDIYEVLWKVPALEGGLRLGIHLELPDGCVDLAGTRAAFSGGAFIERRTVRRAGGLAGGTIRIRGLSGTMTDVLVRIERGNGAVLTARLTPGAPSMVVAAEPGWLQVARTYAGLGVGHILLGIDHLLFVLALLLLVRGRRRIAATVTAFTVAHSLTLAAAVLGWVRVPQRPVEAVIALSILFVAAEVVQVRTGRPGLTARQPWLAAFAFGLLHGLGFAGALAEVGLPETAIPVALLFFNLGVEAGQIAFVAAVLLAAALARRLPAGIRARPPAWAWRAPPYAIGGLAAFWLLQRTAA